MSPEARYAVVYDGNCAVCRKFIDRLAIWDAGGILQLIPSQATGVSSRFSWIPARAFEESVQVVRLSDAHTFQGAAALEELLRVLPGGGAAGWVFRIPFARGVAERMYRAFARNRRRLGCGDHCRTI